MPGNEVTRASRSLLSMRTLFDPPPVGRQFMRFRMARSLTAGALAAAFLSVASAVAAAQGGTVSGTVTGEQGQPLQEAHILVTGMSFTAQTGPDGKYTLRNVPAGTVEIRVLRVGYQSTKKSVRVIDGQTEIGRAHV